ncbi:MAG TPA: glycosyltransferase family 1 protein [Solirubrobacteraceae bacterium]|nr:glycosyltransferase family 1 protein [Solirubrobacteraceae bacterium]
MDLLYLIPGETGGRETYARELVAAMLAQAPELKLTAFVSRDAGDGFGTELGEGVRTVILPISPASRAQWALGEVALISVAARRAGVELLHSMANFAPAWGPFRRVVTIHDLHYRALPELLPWSMRTGTAALVWMGARSADRIIAVSASGREEIVTGLGVGRERIDVIPNGVRRPTTEQPAAQDERVCLRLGRRSVALAVASDLPHKNLGKLIDALALIPTSERPVLVIAGHRTREGGLPRQLASVGVSEDVRLLGSCSQARLEALYALADCLVVPSLHEGFGLPVLEAMSRSLPVVCSDIAALREVAGDAARYFDPRASEQIASKMIEVLGDSTLAERMRTLGRERAGSFSWAAAAQKTLASYRRALAR